MEDDDFSDENLTHPTGARPPLSLRQIEVFRNIMMAGSISGAGRILHVSQPAISRVLALTESRLGYRLFERSRGRLLPTPEARRLYAEVEEVYNGIQRVNHLAASLGEAGSGILKIISSASFGQNLIPRALAGFQARNAHAQVDYRSVTFDEQVGYFLSGEADVGVSMAPPDHPHLKSTLLGHMEIVCILPEGHPLGEKTVIRPDDFLRGAWIGYPPGAPLSRALLAFFGDAGPPCPAAIEVHSPVTAHAFAQHGLGPALVDASCLPKGPSSLMIRPIEPRAAIEIWATRPDLTPLSLLGRRFLSAVKSLLDPAQP
ncbi:LysR family transcriptional regulator [Parapusillimonas sp. JC17]|uniref:LysR family transcriptional regulator n=1 Tax=Parapusillimonas sp. JC17 TaxID=3445768 RepID=UPI003F9F2B11